MSLLKKAVPSAQPTGRGFLMPGITAIMVLVLGLTVASCRQEEQNRTLLYKKGEYLGKQDQQLDPQTLTALTQRSRYQSYY